MRDARELRDETREDDGKVRRIAAFSLAAAITIVLVPALVSGLARNRQVTHGPTPETRVVLAPGSFDTVWNDARQQMTSLHPPPRVEAEPQPAAPESAPAPRRRTSAVIPTPPERPVAPAAVVAPPAPQPLTTAAVPVARERPRVLGVDLPTLDDAQRVLDDAAALAGTVARHIPRI
jgi:hypothetical protein